MIKLKDIIDMSFARKIQIRLVHDDKIIFDGEKYSPGYNDMKQKYKDHLVVGIRARSKDGGTLCFDIEEDDGLFL